MCLKLVLRFRNWSGKGGRPRRPPAALLLQGAEGQRKSCCAALGRGGFTGVAGVAVVQYEEALDHLLRLRRGVDKRVVEVGLRRGWRLTREGRMGMARVGLDPRGELGGVGTHGSPLRRSSIWESRALRETAYMPPRAPSNPQFQAASAWPKRRAFRMPPGPVLRRDCWPPRASRSSRPAVHQSPDPQVSVTRGAWIAFRCIQLEAALPRWWRYLTPVPPRVWISSNVAELRPMAPGTASRRLSAYLTTCAMRVASNMRLWGVDDEGSKTTRAPDADASRARLSAPRTGDRGRRQTVGEPLPSGCRPWPR